ncbi:MAG: molybdopterin molybdotransferase MoeA [Pseudomonadota bacterium]
MIAVETALGHIFDLVAPLQTEDVPLRLAAGRVLAGPVAARRDQPPFPTSVMDGYAVRAEDVHAGAVLSVVAEAAAGHATEVVVGKDQAIRIFTGAPVPAGATRVIIQEDVTRSGNEITLGEALDATSPYIRPKGTDFAAGDRIEAPRRLDPASLTLAAAMNLPVLPCRRRPEVAIIATGDELVLPGETPRPDQIVASNGFGIAAMVEAAGAVARLLPIARDTVASLSSAFALAEGADLIVTIGGASVGDHDLVRATAGAKGLETAFYKVAMRPGKPLMAGRLGDIPMIGLPGNPVSALVCTQVFVVPALRVLLGYPAAPAPRQQAPLAAPVPANGPREHYMRARLGPGGLTAFERQDSGLIGVLADADALLIRPPHSGARAAGAPVEYLPLTRER